MSLNLNPDNIRIKTATVKIEIQLSPEEPVHATTFYHSFAHQEHLPDFLEPRVRSVVTDLISRQI